MEDQMQQQEQQPEEMEQKEQAEKEQIIKIAKAMFNILLKEEKHREEFLRIARTPKDQRTPAQQQSISDGAVKAKNWTEGNAAEILKDAIPLGENETEKLKELVKLSLTEVAALPEEEKALYWGALKAKAARLCDMIKTIKEAIPEAKEYPQEAADDIKKALEDEGKEIDEFYKISMCLLTGEWEKALDSEAADYLAVWNFVLYSMKTYLEISDEIEEIVNKKERQLLKEQAKRNRNTAQEAINQISPAIIACEEMGFDYFTSKAIKELPAEARNYILDEHGKLNILSITGEKGRLEDILKDPKSQPTALFSYLLDIARAVDIREYNSENGLVPISLPAFFKRVQIDPRPRKRDAETKELIKRDAKRDAENKLTIKVYRRQKFLELIQPLHTRAGFVKGDLYALAAFDRYIEDTETAYISIPYFLRLIELANEIDPNGGLIKHIYSANNTMTENQIAVEIANRLAMGVLRRGVSRADAETYKTGEKRKPIKEKTTSKETGIITEKTFAPEADPDIIDITITKELSDGRIKTATRHEKVKRLKNYTFTIKFKTLIDECPQFKAALDAIKKDDEPDKAKRQNNKLKDLLTAAIRIIMEKTTMPQYYLNLKIKTSYSDTFKAPTVTKLNTILFITHNGKNPDYKKG